MINKKLYTLEDLSNLGYDLNSIERGDEEKYWTINKRDEPSSVEIYDVGEGLYKILNEVKIKIKWRD